VKIKNVLEESNQQLVEEEYLFIAAGIHLSIYNWGIMLGSSFRSESISLHLDDDVFPPYASHKFNRENIIKIRDYLNRYLERTANE